jgi:hypothetical protein
MKKVRRLGSWFPLSRTIRQAAALLFGAFAAVEYHRRSSEANQTFPFWCVSLHFIYFQLPNKSRALAWFHPVSYIAALVTPVQYALLLYAKPRLENDRMEMWEVSLTTILVRAFVLFLAPLLFHALDLSSNHSSLTNSYSLKPTKPMYLWSLLSFPFFQGVFELFYPLPTSRGDELVLALDTLPPDFTPLLRYCSWGATLFGFALLYLSVLRHSYR